MSDSAFFARVAQGKGDKINPVDMNPATGRVRTNFDGLDLGGVKAAMDDPRVEAAQRRSRSSNGGMTVARPGMPSVPKILGVDKQQADLARFKNDHKDDDWWKQALTARKADKNPRIGQQTDHQFTADMAAHSPFGGNALAKPDDFKRQVANAKPMPVIDQSEFDKPATKTVTGVRRVEGVNGAPPTFVADKTGTDSLADNQPRVPPGDFEKHVADVKAAANKADADATARAVAQNPARHGRSSVDTSYPLPGSPVKPPAPQQVAQPAPVPPRAPVAAIPPPAPVVQPPPPQPVSPKTTASIDDVKGKINALAGLQDTVSRQKMGPFAGIAKASNGTPFPSARTPSEPDPEGTITGPDKKKKDDDDDMEGMA